MVALTERVKKGYKYVSAFFSKEYKNSSCLHESQAAKKASEPDNVNEDRIMTLVSCILKVDTI